MVEEFIITYVVVPTHVHVHIIIRVPDLIHISAVKVIVILVVDLITTTVVKVITIQDVIKVIPQIVVEERIMIFNVLTLPGVDPNNII